MITIFSTPRPFINEFKDIQENAINSFSSNPGVEIILFDDEESTTSKIYSSNNNINVITNIEYNANRTPKLLSVFNYIKSNAKFDVVVHINSDILISENFSEKIVKIFRMANADNVFASGRRYNVDLSSIQNIKYKNILDSIDGVPILHGKSGLDYWAMNKSSMVEIPDFNCGRPGIDSFLCYESVMQDYATIDCTDFIKIYHQNHPYPSKKKAFFALECKENIALAGGYRNMMSMRNFKFRLDGSGNYRYSAVLNFTYALLKSKLLLFVLGIYREFKNGKF
jgi:hypothetical protein